MHRSETSEMPGHRLHPWLPVAVACLLALCGVGLWLYLTAPADATRIPYGATAWRSNRVQVSVLSTSPHGLQQGDVVVAIAGRSLESWAEARLIPGGPSLDAVRGQTVSYTVLRHGRQVDVPVTLSAYSLDSQFSQTWGMFLFIVVFAVVGLLVYLLRPAEPAAQALLVMAGCAVGTIRYFLGLQVIDLTRDLSFWLSTGTVMVIALLFWSSALHFSLVFPVPHAFARRRWILPLFYVMPFALFALFLALTRLVVPNTLTWLGLWQPGEGTIGILCIGAAIWTLAATYRAHSAPDVRQKIRWVVFAIVLSGGSTILLWMLPTDLLGHAIVDTNALGVLLLPFPLALAIAIVRYQLFDIDVIINRALVYGILSAIMAAMFVSGEFALQSVFRAWQWNLPLIGRNSPPAIVATTLLIAAAFQPLRRQVQTGVDRRFYPSKYYAARTVESFIETLRGEFDLAQLCQGLGSVLEKTLQPESTMLWLPTSGAGEERTDQRLWEDAARLESPLEPTSSASDGGAQP